MKEANSTELHNSNKEQQQPKPFPTSWDHLHGLNNTLTFCHGLHI